MLYLPSNLNSYVPLGIVSTTKETFWLIYFRPLKTLRSANFLHNFYKGREEGEESLERLQYVYPARDWDHQLSFADKKEPADKKKSFTMI